MAQRRRAFRYIREPSHAGEPFYVNRIVLVEMVWVLSGTYGYERHRIANVLDRLLRTTALQIEDRRRQRRRQAGTARVSILPTQ